MKRLLLTYPKFFSEAFRLEKFKVGVLLVSLLGLSGCYMSGGISDLAPSTAIPGLDKTRANGAEFVSGSGEYETTFLKKYKILSSSGGYNAKVMVKTARGYKVYSSVMGTMLSKELDK